MLATLAQVVAYLIGGIPFGLLIARWRSGIDIRQHGSGNIGATNVGRTLGFRWFVIVFLLDFLKGAVPVAVALYLQQRYGAYGHVLFGEVWGSLYGLPALVGLAAILGHVFPIYLKLRGGKGVATSIGVVLLLAPWAALAGIFAWIMLTLSTRMVAVGSIGFAVVFAVIHFCSHAEPFGWDTLPTSLFVILVVALVIIRHLSNIGRILRGTENKITWFSRNQAAAQPQGEAEADEPGEPPSPTAPSPKEAKVETKAGGSAV